MDEWTLNDLLECSVCLERLDVSSKVLPCQHTFCKACLEGIVKKSKELRCPECRVLVCVDVDALPPNVLLQRILGGMKISSKEKERGENNATLNDQNEKLNETKKCFMTATLNSKTAYKELIPTVPHAVALFDHKGRDTGELSFKYGDNIILKRKLMKVNEIWYQGEYRGVTGIFPSSYVKVMIPLSNALPLTQQELRCKALYDFKKCHEQSDGCLFFSKGEMIDILRRIDENWIEGKLDNRIGIFPQSYVELSNAAKAFLSPPKSLTNDNKTSENVPSLIPFVDQSRSITSTDHLTSLNLYHSSAASSSSSTSTITPSSSSSESTTPSSPPTCSPPTDAISIAATQKRHSYTHGIIPPHPYFFNHPPFRKCEGLEQGSSSIQCQSENVAPPVLVAPTSEMHARILYHIQLKRHMCEGSETTQSILDVYEADPRDVRDGVLAKNRITAKREIHSRFWDPPVVPCRYVALFPYKPTRSDELELIVGNMYIVKHRCEDGWCVTDVSEPPIQGRINELGFPVNKKRRMVFPGTYVAPTSVLPRMSNYMLELMENKNLRPNMSKEMVMHLRRPLDVQHFRESIVRKFGDVENSLKPPAIPQRSASLIFTQEINRSGANLMKWQTSLKLDGNVKVTDSNENESRLARCDVLLDSISRDSSRQDLSNNSKGRAKREEEIKKEKNIAGNSKNVNTAQDSPKLMKKPKERREKSLMRRIVSMKKGHSPPPAYSMENPVFEDTCAASTIHISHSRSDSCPSRLRGGSEGKAGGSQRVKPHSARSSLPIYTQRMNGHLSSTSCKDDRPAVNHRKCISLDAFAQDDKGGKNLVEIREKYRCIVPYPPNSSFELELRYGDIVYVEKKRADGWYRGILARDGRSGLFPATFVEKSGAMSAISLLASLLVITHGRMVTARVWSLHLRKVG